MSNRRQGNDLTGRGRTDDARRATDENLARRRGLRATMFVARNTRDPQDCTQMLAMLGLGAALEHVAACASDPEDQRRRLTKLGLSESPELDVVLTNPPLRSSKTVRDDERRA